ncbi:DUF721 domain-containing protein [Owenweeksia hongkongensis]|uniref:RNA-binding protein containing Zn ribbon n=1 Tax=Owenweeksia hongkongensis (strain DSM 17368 / CIP 108786 / JCM 12287 / NRRL B-23963 / UST20020801) TaxID=926562 RepID=G8R4H7_OWEHD|nr:DUF721 domain-containing protein [Owenweeksia hongkongensis]AEV32066.1 Protein of unknown function (DUF721) [Owenweeksia hongkongensis DSM 17368]
MKKSNEMSLGDAIQAFLKTNELDEKLLETEIYARWEELAGNAINLKTNKVKVEKGILTVYVNSSVVRNELSLRRSELLERVNLKLRGKGNLKGIQIK